MLNSLNKQFLRARKNNFLVNVVTLTSGTAISQGILFLVTPFLTRLYSPQDFGKLSIYLAIVLIVGNISSLKYESALMLPKFIQNVKALLIISVSITLFISAVALLILRLGENFIESNFSIDIDRFILIIPFGILFIGGLQIFSSLNGRFELYKSIAISKVIQSISTVGFQFLFKTYLFVSQGLILGNLFGSAISFFLLFFLSFKMRIFNFSNISKRLISYNLLKYKNFPKYQALAVFLNSISLNLPVFLLLLLYSPEIAGYYALTNRVLAAPANLISISTREVYYQKAAQLYSENKSIKQLFVKTTLGLVKVGILPFLILGVFARQIFLFIFGDEWLISGIYTQIIIFVSFLSFIMPPTVANIQILGIQKFYMKFEIFVPIARFLALYLGYWIWNNHYYSLIAFSLIGVITNLLLMLISYRKLNSNEKSLQPNILSVKK